MKIDGLTGSVFLSRCVVEGKIMEVNFYSSYGEIESN
jgi:hypothetical protein